MGDGLPVLQLHRPPCAPAAGQRVLGAARPSQRKWRGRPPRPQGCCLPDYGKPQSRSSRSCESPPARVGQPRLRRARKDLGRRAAERGHDPLCFGFPCARARARARTPLSLCLRLPGSGPPLAPPAVALSHCRAAREGRERSWLRPQEQGLPPPPPALRPRRGSQSGQGWLSGLRAESRAPELILGRA